jgi:hypothetical protein
VGNLVNVVTPDGRVVTVPEDTLKGSNPDVVRQETQAESLDRAREEAIKQEQSGVLPSLAAIGAGGLDMIMLGGFGRAIDAIDPLAGQDMRENAQAHPHLRTAGAVASAFIPGVDELAGAGLVGGAGRLGEAALGEAGGDLARGAIYGVGAQVAQSNVTGDPLTVESVAEGAGLGAAFSLGAGFAAGKLSRASKRLVAKRDLLQIDQTLRKPPAEWDSLLSSHDAAQQAAKAANAKLMRQLNAYDAFATGRGFDGAFADTRSAVDDAYNNALANKLTTAPADLAQLRSYQDQLRDIAAKRATDPHGALDDLRGVLAKMRGDRLFNAPALSDDAASFVNSTEKWPRAMQQVDDAIGAVRARYGPAVANNAKVVTEDGKRFYDLLTNTPDGTVSRVLIPADRPPISTDLDQRLTEFSERASQIRRLRQGGYRLDGSAWVKDPTVPADPVGALRQLNKLRDDFTGQFGGVRFPDIPSADAVGESAADSLPRVPDAPVGTIQPVFRGKAPRELREWLAMPKERVAEFANTMDPTTAQVFDAFAKKIGMDGLDAHGGDAAAMVAGTHQSLNDSIEAMEKVLRPVKSALHTTLHTGLDSAWDNTVGSGETPAPNRLATKLLRRAIAYGVAAHFGEGFLGHEVAGEVGYQLSRALTGGLVAAKNGMQNAIENLVAKYGDPASQAVARLGPVTTWLARSFPSGTTDPTADTRQRAANRIAELAHASVVAPDSVFAAVDRFQGMPNDIAAKIHQQIVGTVQHLNAVAPKDPGLDPRGTRSNWLPSYADSIAFAHRLEAAHDPLAAIARLLSGEVHPAAVDTLRQRWPATLQLLSEILSQRDLSRVPYDRALGFSQVLGVPMTGLQNPAVGSAIQARYAAAAALSGPGAAATQAPTGRPPAVNSQVAGSSVANLIR